MSIESDPGGTGQPLKSGPNQQHQRLRAARTWAEVARGERLGSEVHGCFPGRGLRGRQVFHDSWELVSEEKSPRVSLRKFSSAFVWLF